jgi:hypothetical protein
MIKKTRIARVLIVNQHSRKNIKRLYFLPLIKIPGIGKTGGRKNTVLIEEKT